MNKELRIKLESFYKDYNNNLRPLLILLETELQSFPINILNEVRAIHDHVARTYREDFSLEQKNREIDLSIRHISRALLDCYKIIIATKDKRLKKFLRDYRFINLGEVDSGRFFPEINSIWKEAKNHVKHAKLSESNGENTYDKTLALFESATIKYEEAENFIVANDKNLIWSTTHQKRRFWGSTLLAFVISLVTGFIIGIIVFIITSLFGIDILDIFGIVV